MELVWRGKYAADGSRVKPTKVNMFEADKVPVVGTCVELGDNLNILNQWLTQHGPCADLVYIDPPYAVGIDFKRDGEVAYSDRWEDLDAYLAFLDPRLQLLRELLKPTGSMYLHVDWRVAAPLRLLMEDIFGENCFLNQIAWCYGLGGSSPRYWPRKHDTILWFSREPDGHYFEAEQIPATSQRMKGQAKKAPDYWDIPTINNMAKERVNYPTQKPEALLERIIRSSSPPGGVVLDAFCGSGTTLAVAQRLGRLPLGCDSSPIAYEVTRKRLGLD